MRLWHPIRHRQLIRSAVHSSEEFDDEELDEPEFSEEESSDEEFAEEEFDEEEFDEPEGTTVSGAVSTRSAKESVISLASSSISTV